MNDAAQSGRIKTTSTVFDILETLATGDELTVTEITERVEVSKGTVHAHLKTLKDRGYVIQSDSRAYRMSLRFLALGGHVRDTNYKRLYRVAQPEIDMLADRTGERAQLVVEENGYGVYLYQAVGEKGVLTDSYVGRRAPLHSTASGKVYLSQLPEDQVETIIEEVGLEAYTDTTITDRSVLMSELAEIRASRVAYDRGERVEGMACVGVPILSDHEEILGAISLSAPAQRMQQDDFETEVTELLESAARIIGLNATYA